MRIIFLALIVLSGLYTPTAIAQSADPGYCYYNEGNRRHKKYQYGIHHLNGNWRGSKTEVIVEASTPIDSKLLTIENDIIAAPSLGSVIIPVAYCGPGATETFTSSLTSLANGYFLPYQQTVPPSNNAYIAVRFYYPNFFSRPGPQTIHNSYRKGIGYYEGTARIEYYLRQPIPPGVTVNIHRQQYAYGYFGRYQPKYSPPNDGRFLSYYPPAITFKAAQPGTCSFKDPYDANKTVVLDSLNVTDLTRGSSRNPKAFDIDFECHNGNGDKPNIEFMGDVDESGTRLNLSPDSTAKNLLVQMEYQSTAGQYLLLPFSQATSPIDLLHELNNPTCGPGNTNQCRNWRLKMRASYYGIDNPSMQNVGTVRARFTAKISYH